MIIDCHAHFEPRMLDAERVVAKMDQVGVDRIVMIPADATRNFQAILAAAGASI